MHPAELLRSIQTDKTASLAPDNMNLIGMSSVDDEYVSANRLGIPVLSLGFTGGDGHIKDEWLRLKSLKAVEEVYKKIIKRRGGSNNSGCD